MRHPPTSLYIDTEFFVRNNLKLNTSEFKALKETFVKGGLRLLIPKMTERELFRHYEKRAQHSAVRLERAHETYPVSDISLVDLPPRDELVDKCLTELKRQWDAFKGHFVVEELPLVGNLEDVVNWYFSVEPPFSNKKPKEFPDAFILSALEYYHQMHNANIAVVSADGDFSQACKQRRFIEYYEDLEKYVEAFKPALTSDDLIEEPIDPTVPIVTEDLTELKALLGRADTVTSIEVERALSLIRSRGENYRYFFQNNSYPVWLRPLISAGYFKDPPNLVISAHGSVQYPSWLEFEFLKNVCEYAPEEVVQLALQLPAVDNPSVYENILEIALKLDGTRSVKLKPKMIEYAKLENQFLQFRFPQLLAHWTAEGQTEAALELANILVQFVPDPRAEEKQNQRKEVHGDQADPVDQQLALIALRLSPVPRFRRYRKILNEGVGALAEREPFRVAQILIDATATMIRLGKHEDDKENVKNTDYSELWCPQLNKPRRDRPDTKEALVHTLTDSCEKVYEQACESIEALDSALRNQRWYIFKRLRQHLYSLYPNEQTLPWIREFILAHDDYSQMQYGFEFQQMVRSAGGHFGSKLLTEEERTRIFDEILVGPSKGYFREWTGEHFTEIKFDQWRRKFHRRQLQPFAPVLFADYTDYFQRLEADEAAEEITDETYMAVSKAKGGWVKSQSPKSSRELASLSDRELIDYINEWEHEYWDSDDHLTEFTIEGLAGSFQKIFVECIIPSDARLNFWIENRHNILRPIYVRSIIYAMRDNVKSKNFDKLEEWFSFCRWALTHPDSDSEELAGIGRLGDGSREHPRWHTSRRAVCDFVETCIDQDVDVALCARENLASLLEMLCTQYDWCLDNDNPVLLNRDDQLTEAINTTRGRALENLVKFGFWIRMHDDKAEMVEMTTILERRFGSETEYPLTLPEYAILGMHFGSLFDLDEEWAVANKLSLLPQNDPAAWREAFGNFLRWSSPYRSTFDTLRSDFEFALGHLDSQRKKERIGRELTQKIGEYLFTFYLWNVYPLKGSKSLLERFYQKTDDDREHWATLFNYVGHSLRNTGRHVEKPLKDRIVAFFEWRLEAGDPLELREFADWLEAECLDPEWRLNAFLQVLQIDNILNDTVDSPDDQGDSAANWLPMDTTQALQAMLSDNTPRVVECFAKLTDFAPRSSVTYIPNDDARAILNAGFEHENENVRKDAERARENLLRNGLFGILD